MADEDDAEATLLPPLLLSDAAAADAIARSRRAAFDDDVAKEGRSKREGERGSGEQKLPFFLFLKRKKESEKNFKSRKKNEQKCSRLIARQRLCQLFNTLDCNRRGIMRLSSHRAIRETSEKRPKRARKVDERF